MYHQPYVDMTPPRLESVFSCSPLGEIKRVTYSGKSNSLAAATYQQRNMWLSQGVTKGIKARGHCSYKQHKGRVRADAIKEEAGDSPPLAIGSVNAFRVFFLSPHPMQCRVYTANVSVHTTHHS